MGPRLRAWGIFVTKLQKVPPYSEVSKAVLMLK